MIGGFERGLLAVLLVVLMIGMGATLTPQRFREIARAPRAALVGVASQFGWMPLIAMGLARVLELPTELAIGLIIVGCTPGGTTSNMFTYYARGDVALSIAMTVISTTVAVAAMPLLLWVYAGPLTGADIRIPYGNIVTTLVLVLLPVGIGVVIRARSERAAQRAEAFGAVSGILVLVLLVGTSLIRNSDVLAQVPMRGYLASISLGILGMGLGYVGARALGLPVAQRRAVAFETGIQNSPLAFAIILASFPAEIQAQLLWLPMAYALFVLLNAAFVTFLLRRSRA